VLDVKQTDAIFYLLPNTSINEEGFAQQLFGQQNVSVLP